jgi:Tol biopolymer transport system component
LVVNSTSLGVRTVSGGSGESIKPNWSPDGSRIAFQSNRVTSDGTIEYEIYTVASSVGAVPVQITDNSV